MTPPLESYDIALAWLAKADDDLLAAQHLLIDTDSWAFGSVCYHAQQCAEKAVKAVLSGKGMHFPKTHDITELVALLPSDIDIGLTPDDQDLLSDYAMTTRYPGDVDPLTREDADHAVALAQAALTSARSIVSDLVSPAANASLEAEAAPDPLL